MEVTPQFWLPVALVESRISSDIRANVASMRQEAVRRQQAADSAR